MGVHACVCVWPLVKERLQELAPATIGLRHWPCPGRGRPSWFMEVALEDRHTSILHLVLPGKRWAAFVRFLELHRPRLGHLRLGDGAPA